MFESLLDHDVGVSRNPHQFLAGRLPGNIPYERHAVRAHEDDCIGPRLPETPGVFARLVEFKTGGRVLYHGHAQTPGLENTDYLFDKGGLAAVRGRRYERDDSACFSILHAVLHIPQLRRLRGLRLLPSAEYPRSKNAELIEQVDRDGEDRLVEDIRRGCQDRADDERAE